MFLCTSNVIGKLGSLKPKLIHNFNLLRHIKYRNNVKINYLTKKFSQKSYNVNAIRNQLFEKKIMQKNFDYEDVNIIQYWLKKNATLISTVTPEFDILIKAYKYKNQNLTVTFCFPWTIVIETRDLRIISEIQMAVNELNNSE